MCLKLNFTGPEDFSTLMDFPRAGFFYILGFSLFPSTSFLGIIFGISWNFSWNFLEFFNIFEELHRGKSEYTGLLYEEKIVLY